MTTRRSFVALVVVLILGVGTYVSSQTVLPLFRTTFDYDLAPAPAGTVEFHPYVSPEGNRYLIFRLDNGQLIARRDMVDFYQPTPSTPIPPMAPPEILTCPNTHCACQYLPAGSYSKAWAEAAFKCS